jgi:hypothetical protein
MHLPTRLFMQCSSAMMLAAGFLFTFAPAETLGWAGSSPSPHSVLLIQAVGALYVGFAVLNWMAKDNLIGGIYSRPVALANFSHFFILAAALVKATAAGRQPLIVWTAAGVYVLLAACFGLIVFTSPLPRVSHHAAQTTVRQPDSHRESSDKVELHHD